MGSLRDMGAEKALSVPEGTSQFQPGFPILGLNA